MEQLPPCYFCPRRAMAAAHPVFRKGQVSILVAQHTQEFSALLALKAGSGLVPFIFALISSCLGASSHCSYQPMPLRCRAGQGKPHARPAHPPHPTAAPLGSSAFGLSLFFSPVDFTYHPSTRPSTPLYPVLSPACTNTNPAFPAHQVTQDNDVLPQR